MRDRLPPAWRNLRAWSALLVTALILVVACTSDEAVPTPAATALTSEVAPITGAFLPLPSPQSLARSNFTATTLTDNRVLLAAGRGVGTTSAADVFDPASETFQEVSPPLVARNSHSAVLLTDGRVLLIGGLAPGSGNTGAPLDSTEIWNPATEHFTRAASMKRPRSAHAAVTLSSGHVLVSGGFTESAAAGLQRRPLAAAELYDPSTDRFTFVEPMNVARADHQLTLLPDGRVLVSGGGPLELYDPATGRFTLFEGEPILGPQPTVATLLADGRILLTAARVADPSSDADLDYARGALIVDPTGEEVIPVGDMFVARSQDHTATLLTDGRVLITGGAAGVGAPRFYPPSELFDPATERFRPISFVDDPEIPGGLGAINLATHLPTHTASRLPDGTILIIGYEPQTRLTWAIERFDPAAESTDDRFAAFVESLGRRGTPIAATPGAVLDVDSFLPFNGSGNPFGFDELAAAVADLGLQIRYLPSTVRGCGGIFGSNAQRLRAELPGHTAEQDFSLWIYPTVAELSVDWLTDETGRVVAHPDSPCSDLFLDDRLTPGPQALINENLVLLLGLFDPNFNERNDETRALLIEAFEAIATPEE